MMNRITLTRLGTACLIAAVSGAGMASCSHGGDVRIDCTAVPGTALPDGFAADFCAVLRDDIALNRPATAPAAKIKVDLARAGEFAVTATVTVDKAGGGTRSQDFSLSVRDSSLQPSIAKTLVYSLLQLLE